MLAIIFAFFANGFYVFRTEHRKSAGEIIREFFSFVGMRLFAMVVEVVGTNLLCDSFRYNEFISKIIIQIVVLVINYIFSKCFVFRKDKKPVRQILADNYIMIISFMIPAVFMAVLMIVTAASASTMTMLFIRYVHSTCLLFCQILYQNLHSVNFLTLL